MTQRERIPVRISPDLLDTIGRQFRFRHGKGVSEWLKNSLDQYLRLRQQGQESLAGGWPVLMNLVDGNTANTGPNLILIDFGGTTYPNIHEFFLHWGDTRAATLGGSSHASVTGGHGNGGKFYMRGMWRGGCRFLTWRDGKVTSLVVEKTQDGTTGYWEEKDLKCSWQDALTMAHQGLPEGVTPKWVKEFLANDMSEIEQELDQKSRGLTVLVGMRAVQANSSNDMVVRGKWQAQKLVDDILDSSQAKRPLRELEIYVFVNGTLQPNPLEDRKVQLDPDFGKRTVVVADTVLGAREEGNAPESVGILSLAKSDTQLTGRLKHLNSLFILDANLNPVASYPIRELPLPSHSPLISFMSAELTLNFDGLRDLIQNDRERLLQSPQTDSILSWCSIQIGEWMNEIDEEQARNEKRNELQEATILNDQLNDHAARFLQQLESDMFVDFVESSEGGGFGDAGEGIAPRGKGKASGQERNTGTGGSEGDGGTKEVDGSTEKSRRPRFPQVLVSGIDADPSDPNGGTRKLTPRHPPLDQDDSDRINNVWWINTSHPFAELALTKGGPRGVAFSNHQLSMFRDVVQREGLRYLQRRDRELDLDQVENELSDISNRFLGELPRPLADLLMGSE